MLTGALSVVLVSRASEFLTIENIKKFIKKIFFLQILFLVLIIVAIPFSRFLPLFLGEAYNPSVSILQLLLIATYFQMAITPLNSVFYPLGKSEIFAIDSVLKVVLLFFLNNNLLSSFGAKGAAYSLLIVNIVIFVVNYLYLFLMLKNEKATSSLG
jgi:O-antigen/teichoic acid export membrane protein